MERQHIHYDPMDYARILRSFKTEHPVLFEHAHDLLNDVFKNDNGVSVSLLESLVLEQEAVLDEDYTNVICNFYLCARDHILKNGDYE